MCSQSVQSMNSLGACGECQQPDTKAHFVVGFIVLWLFTGKSTCAEHGALSFSTFLAWSFFWISRKAETAPPGLCNAFFLRFHHHPTTHKCMFSLSLSLRQTDRHCLSGEETQPFCNFPVPFFIKFSETPQEEMTGSYQMIW